MLGKVVRLRQAKLFLMRPVAQRDAGETVRRATEHLTEAEMDKASVPRAASGVAIRNIRVRRKAARL